MLQCKFTWIYVIVCVKFSDESAECMVDVADNFSHAVTLIPDEPDVPQTPDDLNG